MFILGVADGFDSGAALFQGTQLLAVEYEHRLKGQRDSAVAIPWGAIESVLTRAKLDARDIGIISVAGRFTPSLFMRQYGQPYRPVVNNVRGVRQGQSVFQSWMGLTGLGALEADRTSEWFDNEFRKQGFRPNKVNMVATHRALGEAAYRFQTLDPVLVLTLHPSGDGLLSGAFIGRGGQLDLVASQGNSQGVDAHIQWCVGGEEVRGSENKRVFWAEADDSLTDQDGLAELNEKYEVREGAMRLTRPWWGALRRDTVHEKVDNLGDAVSLATRRAHWLTLLSHWVSAHVEMWSCGDVVLAGELFDDSWLIEHLSRLEGVNSLYTAPGVGWESLPLGAGAYAAGRAPSNLEANCAGVFTDFIPVAEVSP